MEQFRNKIDAIDRKMIELLNTRMKYAIHLGEIKERLNLPVYMPEREKEVIHNILMNNHGPLSNDAARRLYERIIDESRRVEREHSETNKTKK